MAYHVTIKKWGNSLSVRIPATAAQEIGVTDGSEVTLDSSSGMLTLRPVRRPRRRLVYKLDDLLADYQPAAPSARRSPFGSRREREAL